MRLPLPLQGLYTKSASIDEPTVFTEYSNNVRSIDVQEGKIRIGQRPGQLKLNAVQIGGAAQPVVAMMVVAVVENTEG